MNYKTMRRPAANLIVDLRVLHGLAHIILALVEHFKPGRVVKVTTSWGKLYEN